MINVKITLDIKNYLSLSKTSITSFYHQFIYLSIQPVSDENELVKNVIVINFNRWSVTSVVSILSV